MRLSEEVIRVLRNSTSPVMSTRCLADSIFGRVHCLLLLKAHRSEVNNCYRICLKMTKKGILLREGKTCWKLNKSEPE